MALEKINLTFNEAFKVSMENKQPFKLPEWGFTVMADPDLYLIYKGETEEWRFVTDKDMQRTDWQLVSTEFTVEGPIEQKSIKVPMVLNILCLKEKFGFKYVSIYDGYVLNINKDWKLFLRNGEFQLNCVENKIGDVVHTKSLGLKIESIEELETLIKFLNLQPQ